MTTNTTSNEIDKVIDSFVINAGKHNYEVHINKPQAKQTIQRLIVSERLDEVKNIYADNVFTTQTGIGVQHVVISQAFDSRITELQFQLDNKGGSDE